MRETSDRPRAAGALKLLAVVAAAVGLFWQFLRGPAPAVLLYRAARSRRSPLPALEYSRHQVLRGVGGDDFVSPSGICAAPDGNLFVSDSAVCRVYRITPKGRLVAVIGGLGQAPGKLDTPTDVAITRAGLLCVADTGNNRVELMTQDGRFVGTLRQGLDKPTTVAPLRDGGLVAASYESNDAGVARFGAAGLSERWRLAGPFQGEVRFAPDGTLYTLNLVSCLDLVTAYGPRLRPASRFGGATGPFGDPRRLYLPRALRVTARRVFLCRGDGRIVIYDRRGGYIQTLPRRLMVVRNGRELVNPVALDADSHGDLWVCVQGSNTVQELVPRGPGRGTQRR